MSAMNLKQFLVRLEVLCLYRDIFRTLRQVQDKTTREELTVWARTDFRKNMHEKDDLVIKSMLRNGQNSLKELKQSIAFSASSQSKSKEQS